MTDHQSAPARPPTRPRRADRRRAARHRPGARLRAGCPPSTPSARRPPRSPRPTCPASRAAAVAGHSGKIRSIRAGDEQPAGLPQPHPLLRGQGRRGRRARRPHRGRGRLPGDRAHQRLRRAEGDWTPGTPVLISDHINLTGRSPIEGANFVDLTDLYSSRLRAMCREVEPSLDEGVYVQFPGPHYETPAEIGMVRAIGGDLAGMSTTLEAIAAREAGHGDPRHQPGHQPRRRHVRRAARPRRGPRGRQGRRRPGWASCSPRSSRGSDDAGPRHRRSRHHRPRGHHRPRRPRPRGRRSRPAARARGLRRRPGTPPTAPTSTPSLAVFAEAASARRASSTWPASPTESSLPDALTSHVVTHRRAARRDGRPRRQPDRLRLVQPRRRPHARARDLLGVDVPPRPDTFYGVAKVAAEALLRLYVDRLRHRRRRLPDRLVHRAARDRPRLVHLALPRRLRPDGRRRAHRRPRPASPSSTASRANTRAWWDLEPGRAPRLRAAGRRRGVRRPGRAVRARQRGRGARRWPVRRSALRAARPGSLADRQRVAASFAERDIALHGSPICSVSPRSTITSRVPSTLPALLVQVSCQASLSPE